MQYSVMDIDETDDTTGYIGAYEYTATYRHQTADWAVVCGETGRLGFGSDVAKCVAIVQAAHDADLN